jgi:hypothetical protein
MYVNVRQGSDVSGYVGAWAPRRMTGSQPVPSRQVIHDFDRRRSCVDLYDEWLPCLTLEGDDNIQFLNLRRAPSGD